MMEKDRNILKCPNCGFEIYTEANERSCAKCDTQMEFIMKESEFKKGKK